MGCLKHLACPTKLENFKNPVSLLLPPLRQMAECGDFKLNKKAFCKGRFFVEARHGVPFHIEIGMPRHAATICTLENIVTYTSYWDYSCPIPILKDYCGYIHGFYPTIHLYG